MNNIHLPFPAEPSLGALVTASRVMGVRLLTSETNCLWYYRPVGRSIYIWAPDLQTESLPFLLTIFAHELGHVIDLDRNPVWRRQVADLSAREVPAGWEISAFVTGYRLIQRMGIPLPLSAYLIFVGDSIRKAVASSLV